MNERYNRYTEEQINTAQNIDILEYARSKGFDCEKQGREYRLKGNGGLLVNPQTNSFYIHSKQEGGHGAISFCQKVLGMDFKTAMQELIGTPNGIYQPKYAATNPSSIKPQEKRELVLPEPNDNEKRVFAYLTQQRGIDPEVIIAFIRKKLLYQDKRGNAVFVHKSQDDKIIGADILGTYSEKRYKGIAPGSDGVFKVAWGKDIDKVYVFEAPIDMMSFMQMNKIVDNALFISMGGLKPQFLSEYLNNDKYTVISCVDNDKAGKAFNDRILYDKMLQNIPKDLITEKTVDIDNDNIKYIKYVDVNVNGKNVSLFISAEDAKCAIAAGVQVSNPLKWKNNSNFIVNDECKKENVKDFNDLLKKKQISQVVDKAHNIEQWGQYLQQKCEMIKTQRKVIANEIA